VKVAGDLDGDAVAGFFLAVQVTLEFDVDVVGAEDSDEAVDDVAGFGSASFIQGGGERAFVASGQADEVCGVLREFMLEDGAFLFSLGAQLHAGDELAEVPVPGAGSD
jgi:hypothetical protein